MNFRSIRRIHSPLTSLAVGMLCAVSMRAAAPAASPAAIVVENKIIADKPVSPLLYSSYIELTNGHEESILAEMLYDRDFELDRSDLDNNSVNHENQNKKKYKKDAPHRSEYGWENWAHNLWWNSSYEENNWYFVHAEEDKTSTFEKYFGRWWPAGHGDHFASIVNKSKTGTVGLAQDGIRLRKGVPLTFSGLFCDGTHFSATDISKKPVTIEVALYPDRATDGPALTSATLTVDATSLRKFSVTLPAPDRDAKATLVIRVPAGRRLAADLLSLIPSDHVDGFRSDIVELTKTMHLGTIRWPGGCTASFYKWRDGVGPLELRPVTKETFNDKNLVNDIGTVEFVKFCRLIGAEPVICVPVMFGRPEDAADWVAFCNASTHILRKNSGTTGPLGVKYWELDNENYRRDDAITYAHKVVEFSRAMKAVDPSAKIIMADYWIYNSALPKMLEIAGADIDMVVNRGGELPEIRSDIAILKAYNARTGRDITLCDTEHSAHDDNPIATAALKSGGVHPADSVEDKNLARNETHSFWAYAMGTMADYMDFQNLGGAFQFCNYYGAFNHWGIGLLNCGLEEAKLTGSGEAIAFMQSQPIVWPLAVTEVKDTTVKCTAAWNADKTVLTVMVLNYNDTTKTMTLDTSGLGVAFSPEVTVEQISAPGARAYTQENKPSPIRRETKTIRLGATPAPCDFAPFSATAVRLRVNAAK